MRRIDLLFTFLKLPVDFVMLVGAGLLAYTLRYAKFVTAIRPIKFDLPWREFWPTLLLVSIGWIIIFALSGLYTTNPRRKFSKDVTGVILACSTGFAAITIYVFFTLKKFDSRFLVLAGWILAMILVIGGRLMLHGIKRLLYRLGIGLHRVIIIGGETIAERVAEALTAKRYLGYQVVGHYDHFSRDELELKLHSFDEIIFADPHAHEDDAVTAIEFANEHHLTFKYSADLFETITSNFTISTVAGIPIVELQRTRLTGWGRVAKRLIDIVGSILLILITSPLALITSLGVLIETGWPIIYRNERVGQFDKKFIAFKFRSMYQKDSTGDQFGESGKAALKREATLIKKQSSKTGPVYKIMDDPRITPFGKCIRRWSLDELPQFWNVLKGEMSLVGPRPHQPREVDKYDTEHKVLLAIKPGMTGMAQISGRSDLTFQEEARLDTFYIEHWSLYMDLIILLKTPFVVFSRKGAR